MLKERFSNFLDKYVKREIGLSFVVRSLSPFSEISLIVAYFSLSGNTPEERDLLQV